MFGMKGVVDQCEYPAPSPGKFNNIKSTCFIIYAIDLGFIVYGGKIDIQSKMANLKVLEIKKNLVEDLYGASTLLGFPVFNIL